MKLHRPVCPKVVILKWIRKSWFIYDAYFRQIDCIDVMKWANTDKFLRRFWTFYELHTYSLLIFFSLPLFFFFIKRMQMKEVSSSRKTNFTWALRQIIGPCRGESWGDASINRLKNLQKILALLSPCRRRSARK